MNRVHERSAYVRNTPPTPHFYPVLLYRKEMSYDLGRKYRWLSMTNDIMLEWMEKMGKKLPVSLERCWQQDWFDFERTPVRQYDRRKFFSFFFSIIDMDMEVGHAPDFGLDCGETLFHS